MMGPESRMRCSTLSVSCERSAIDPRPRLALARYFRARRDMVVLPAPDSPVMTIDWLRLFWIMLAYAEATSEYTCVLLRVSEKTEGS